MPALLEPPAGLELVGFELLGRGPTATGAAGGWHTSDQLYFQCAACGDLMQSETREYFTCTCSAMRLDVDACRFGSTHGDLNILVYKRLER